jgi:enamine deaminase RidA (YjgF/YER057c/UK114 family)
LATTRRQFLRVLGQGGGAAVLGMEDVVQCTVFLADIADFQTMNGALHAVLSEGPASPLDDCGSGAGAQGCGGDRVHRGDEVGAPSVVRGR